MRAALHLDELRPANAPTLREQVRSSVGNYFELLEGEQARDLYALVLAEVEAPLLAAVMQQTRGNQSKAAIVLGLNRGTLRTKLKQYGLL
ncbi:MAG: DNA-binding transcriptional regulator Fis [Proteobacteria bacterium]|nr:DNA-binding transcriptional regulator Fis [Pseudomonadota bacterium]MDA0896510.1 DNA-binding transcriptional regulator Fis [Pseudomonadota bacterium]MDA1244430.1 DNA-binding transcriptional regulator Fis [Pseudomonadota bacterium]